MGKFYSLSTIRKKVREYGKRVNAPKKLLTVRSTADGFGAPHIEIDQEGYHYAIWERGREHERKTTQDLDELLYWIFEDIVFLLASEYELQHRQPNKNSRRMLFSKELELMEKLNPQWGKRKKKNIKKILEKYPYDDEK